MKRAQPHIVRKAEPPAQDELQPSLLLPQENSDDHPLMKKYAKISEQALKNSPPGLDQDSKEDPQARIG